MLGRGKTTKSLKALCVRLIGLPGSVVRHARQLVIRLGASAEPLETIIAACQIIRALVHRPAEKAALPSIGSMILLVQP